MADIDFTQPIGLGYDNPDDAATAAAMSYRALPRTKEGGVNDTEFASVIFKNKKDGKFYRTAFNTSHSDHQVNVRSILDGMANDQVPVAVIHNHPQVKGNLLLPYLSKNDSKVGEGVSLQRGNTGPLKMYLLPGNVDDQNIRVGNGQYDNRVAYDPDERAMNSMMVQETDPVLGQIPWDEYQKVLAQKMGRSPNDPRGAYMDTSPQLVATRGNNSILQ